MKSVRDASEVIGKTINVKTVDQLWPSTPYLLPNGSVSVARLSKKFAEAGARLRQFDMGGPNVWPHLNRNQISAELRARLRDPARIDQNATGLCGPLSILFELARRRPAEYVRAAIQLLETGVYTTPNGRAICAEEELRNEEIPVLVFDTGGTRPMPHVDWMMAATLRDDENAIEDVDSGGMGYNGIETITWPTEMKGWVQDILGLHGDVDDCWSAGEIDALRNGMDAIREGGVAFLCIDVNLVRDGGNDSEEEMWFRIASHLPKNYGDVSKKYHSLDDSVFPWPDHYVVLLDGVELDPNADEDSESWMRVPTWSWGGEYRLEGTPSSLSEYLYSVIIGRPS